MVYSLALVLGGALGNFISRIIYSYVIDFLDFRILPNYHWPSFNVADIAITVGVVLLLIKMSSAEKKEETGKNQT